MHLNICDCCGKRITHPGLNGEPLDVSPKVTILIELRPVGASAGNYSLFEFCEGCEPAAQFFHELIRDTFNQRVKEFKSIEVKQCHG